MPEAPAPDTAAIRSILAFWFGDCVRDDAAIAARMALWFGNDPQLDATIREKFLGHTERAAAGELRAWQLLTAGRLALVILLDQFPRNLFRGTARAFASDAAALKICELSINDDSLLALEPVEQVFLLMPMQHSESREVQERSVQQSDALLQRLPEWRRPHYEGFAKYARLHRDIVTRFGRFPHRNAILGRENTEEEAKYLADGAPGFGQS